MNLRVEPATEHDVSSWRALAAEVGDLFGADMANDSAFLHTLRRNIVRGTALCIRIDGSIAGAVLLNAGSIKWFAVLKRFRRRGVARALVAHVQSVHSEVRVTTFGAGHPHPDSQASRVFYRTMGFTMLNDATAAGPDGTPREELVWRAR